METKGYPQKQKNINVRKVKNVLGIDTETIMDLQNAMPFDIGYVVYNNKEDKIEKQGTYLVRKFVNNKYIILSSWSANKYERHYKPLLNTKTKDVKVESVEKIAKEFAKIIKKYNIKYMFAHNGQFDYQALKRLFKDVGVENPFENLDIIDTMMLSYKTITTTKEYENFCKENSNIKKLQNNTKVSRFITKDNKVRQTAESIFAFIDKNIDFEENHTGLEDIRIELEIFKYCKSKRAIFPINIQPSRADFVKLES